MKYKEYRNKHKQLHRINGPAVVNEDGTKQYFHNGLRHRLRGPAIIHADGTKEYWVSNMRHKIDGPAVIHPDGKVEWWYWNNDITEVIEKVLKEKWHGRQESNPRGTL